MDMVFPLKPHYFNFKILHKQPLVSPSPFLSSSLQFSASNPQFFKPQFAAKQIRVLSEFDSRANGVLSGDSDPRFLDRIVRSTVMEGTGQIGSFQTRSFPLQHQEEEIVEEFQ